MKNQDNFSSSLLEHSTKKQLKKMNKKKERKERKVLILLLNLPAKYLHKGILKIDNMSPKNLSDGI